jgi:hypothetical protein
MLRPVARVSEDDINTVFTKVLRSTTAVDGLIDVEVANTLPPLLLVKVKDEAVGFVL